VTLSTANQLLKLEALAKQEAVRIAEKGDHQNSLNFLQEPSRIDAATFFRANSLNSTQTSSSTSHPLTADTRLREIIARLRNCVESDVEVKDEAERLKKDMLSEMVNSYEGERVQRVKELMEQKMQEMVDALGMYSVARRACQANEGPTGNVQLGSDGDSPRSQTQQMSENAGTSAEHAVLA
jgi:hypothetical protein